MSVLGSCRLDVVAVSVYWAVLSVALDVVGDFARPGDDSDLTVAVVGVECLLAAVGCSDEGSSIGCVGTVSVSVVRLWSFLVDLCRVGPVCWVVVAVAWLESVELIGCSGRDVGVSGTVWVVRSAGLSIGDWVVSVDVEWSGGVVAW